MDGEALSAGMKPSDVVLAAPLPLIGTFNRAEREIAAALIVRACQVEGDRWHAVTPKQVGAVLSADLDAAREPWATINHNPFAPRPNFDELVDRGFARWEDGRARIALTDAGLEAVAKHRRRTNGGAP